MTAVLPVIVSTYLINRTNADALLSARAELLVDGLENQLTGLLNPVARQFEAARDHIEAQGLTLDDAEPFEDFVEGLLLGAPQLSGVGVIRPDQTMRRWEAGRSGAIEEPQSALPFAAEALASTRQGQGTNWASPFVSRILDDVILNPRVGLYVRGSLTGVLVGGVTGTRLSDYVAELSDENITAFVLYDRTGLIAYPGRVQVVQTPASSDLPTIAESSSSVLRNIWSEQNPLTQTSRLSDTEGHWSLIDGAAYAYFYREIEGYGPANLMVGVAIKSSESWLFRWSAAISAGIGVAFFVVALWIGRYTAKRIAQPFVQLDGALGRLQRMEFDDVVLPDLQNSSISEWRTSATRLARTARALASFNQYVPRSLARRLMDQPEDAAAAVERNVTVMFLDLEGFTAFAADRAAADTADWLNGLFAKVGPIIEDTGGVIDKYTGDGLMAFWGAPDPQPDHEHRAVKAAMAIAHELHRSEEIFGDNKTLRVRIGLHSGPAIVGNLGFEGRVNYTLVGNTVNRAERVEQRLRGQHPDHRVIVGISSDMWKACGSVAGIEPIDRLHLTDGRTVIVCRDPAQSA
ncbi:MAG: adenylate/guanylate cyclase domain-containing protein [Pseudomonadota bacterium]